VRAPTLAIIVSASLSVSAAAHAMEIRQFDKMDLHDQGDYVELLIRGAESTLTAAGRADEAAQVEKLFTIKDPGDRDSHGIIEFELSLAHAREADARRVLKDANAPRLEVEDAMAVMLKKNGIALPDSFFTVNANFHAKLPPRQ